MKKLFSIILILLFTGICFAENKEFKKARTCVDMFMVSGHHVVIIEKNETTWIQKSQIKYISTKETELVIHYETIKHKELVFDELSFPYESYTFDYADLKVSNLVITRK